MQPEGSNSNNGGEGRRTASNINNDEAQLAEQTQITMKQTWYRTQTKTTAAEARNLHRIHTPHHSSPNRGKPDQPMRISRLTQEHTAQNKKSVKLVDRFLEYERLHARTRFQAILSRRSTRKPDPFRSGMGRRPFFCRRSTRELVFFLVFPEDPRGTTISALTWLGNADEQICPAGVLSRRSTRERDFQQILP